MQERNALPVILNEVKDQWEVAHLSLKQSSRRVILHYVQDDRPGGAVAGRARDDGRM